MKMLGFMGKERFYCAAGLALAASAVVAEDVAAQTIYGIDSGKPTQQLLTFNAATPGVLQSAYAIQGLQTNEQLIGIDIRPQDGLLYGVGNSGRLYQISTSTGEATQVPLASPNGEITPILNGTRFGVDFNPVANALRIVSDLGQNLRIPFGGATPFTTLVDGALNYAATDVNAGQTPNVVGAAYTNSFAGAAATTLYDVDSILNVLTTQLPPNSGTLNTVGPLGINPTSLLGFDIGPGNVGFASVQLDPSLPVVALYTINLNTGTATLVGTIGRGEDGPLVSDIAVVPEPAGLGLLGLAAAGLLARRRRVLLWVTERNGIHNILPLCNLTKDSIFAI